MPGVERVVRIPETPIPGAFMPLGGVAVIAKNTWAAIKGRDALKITWDAGPNAAYDSKAYKATLEAAVRAPGKPGRTHGDVADGAGRRGAQASAAEYYVPHLSHAQMEPVAALAQRDERQGRGLGADAVAAWTRATTIAEYLKVDVGQRHGARHAAGRRLRPQVQAGLPLRGGLPRARGRRAGARAVDARGRPAELVLPLASPRIASRPASTRTGKVTAWLHRSAYPAIGATFAPNVTGPTPDELTNGASDIPFDIPNMSVEACPAVAHTRIGWYRSVNAIHHGFAIGSFVDELAHAAGKDPADFLLELHRRRPRVDLSKAGLVAPASNYGATWADHPLDTARARSVVRAGDREERVARREAAARQGARHRDSPQLPLLRGDGGRGRGAARRDGAGAEDHGRRRCRLHRQSRSCARRRWRAR